MPKKDLDIVKLAFTCLGLTPTFANEDYKDRNSALGYVCRCGRPCKSSYRRIMLGMEACQPCINEKRRQTNQQRYGVDAPLQNEAIRAAATATNLERYGAATPLESEEIKSKIRDTVRARYGTDYALQSKEIHDKTKATIAKRYGVANPTQHGPFHLKQQRSAYRLKMFRLPSGATLEYQGYEHYCLSELLAEGVSEQALLEGHSCMPSIAYTYGNKPRVYHPDIFLCSDGGLPARLLEVKSSWTVRSDRPVMLEKLRASAALGYAVELRVYDASGARLRSTEREAMAEAFDTPFAVKAMDGSFVPDPEIESLIDEYLSVI